MVTTSAPTTVDQYLASLPDDRRTAISAIRDVVNANLPGGFEEGIQYGMISWYVPLSVYPDTYNGQPLAIASLGSQKNHMALYLMTVYGDPTLDAWFRSAFAAAGKKLDMGKSCVRFKALDALPLEVIGETIGKVAPDQYIARAKAAHATTKPGDQSASSARVMRAVADAAAAPEKPTPKKFVKSAPVTEVAKPAAKPVKAAAKPAKPAKKPAKKSAPAKKLAKKPAKKPARK